MVDFERDGMMSKRTGMMIRRLGILAMVVLAMAGCGRDRAASGGAGEADRATAGPLALLLDAPSSVRAGEEVPIAVTLVNRGAAPASVAGAQPDLVVTRIDGAEVWRRSRHEAPSTGTATTLRSNEMRGSGYTWDQRNDAGSAVAPGSYRIRAESPDLRLVSERRTLVIQP